MKITLLLIIVFIISFILLFIFIYRGNKTEVDAEKMAFFSVSFVALILALLPTIIVGLILFVLLGSTNTVNMIFSIQLSLNQLIVLTISFFVYLFTIDSILEIIFKYLLGKNIVYYISIVLIRVSVFYIIGDIIRLQGKVSIAIALGVSFILFIIELLYNLRESSNR